MPKHERSEYMKGVLFAEEQKEIGWVLTHKAIDGNAICWEWHTPNEDGSKARQIVFAENEFFDGVIDYQKHMERLK